MKYQKSIIRFVIVTAILFLISAQSFADTKESSSSLSYTVKFSVEKGGSLYYDMGTDLAFFLEDDWQNYSSSCKITSGKTYKFSRLIQRNIVVVPNDGYYFAGFFHKNGNAATLEQIPIDILRITKEGIYFYNYFPAHDSKLYIRYSEAAYEKMVKTYLKGLYGTGRYKCMGQEVLYQLPKSAGEYKAVFQKKTAPVQPTPKALWLTYGMKDFSLLSTLPTKYEGTFKSSNSRVLKIDKSTGYVTLKSPGTAIITYAVSEGDKSLPAEFKTKVTIQPEKVASVTAKKTAAKKLLVKWIGSNKNSGYEIQISNNKSFKNILAKKTVTSGKAGSTSVKLKSSLCNNYVRIRPYKNSNGKRIYNSYTVCSITL